MTSGCVRDSSRRGPYLRFQNLWASRLVRLLSRLRWREIHAPVALARDAERVCCFCALRGPRGPIAIDCPSTRPQSIAASAPIRVLATFGPPPLPLILYPNLIHFGPALNPESSSFCSWQQNRRSA